MASLDLSDTVVRRKLASRIMVRTVSLTLSVDGGTIGSTESISLLGTLILPVSLIVDRYCSF